MGKLKWYFDLDQNRRALNGSRLLLEPGAGFDECSPFQCLQAPEVDEGSGEDADKKQHFRIPRPACFADRNRPGVYEHGLEIEDDEEHGDEIEFNVEAHAGSACGNDARFIGLGGLLFLVTLSQDVGECNHDRYQENDRREVDGHGPEGG